MAAESADADKPLEQAFAEARRDEDPGQLLSRARVAAQLFGKAEGGLGRFHVLERLGEGGMGVVYAAYDPELDRGVALKMVRVASRGRELALREAKALAQLSHPNIVPVFDVGFESEHVYIVMELVRGATLRSWTTEHTPSEVIDAYRQVAAGLAAAHDTGIVHRDFKPDNAIVGDDGRVRVVDFGLAAAITSEPGPAGTPAYMAPEQVVGGPVTAAADQYSVCVALREALPAPPKWIAELIARGTSIAPADRFPSMHELARALARDPARLRRRRIITAGGVVLALVASIVAFAAGRRAAAFPACEGGDEELAAAWPAPATALARIASLSRYGSELAQQLQRELGAHASAWTASHRDACIAHRRGAQSDALFDRRVACLDRSRASLAALGELARSAGADQLAGLARAATALPPPAACDDAAALVADVAPPPLAIGAQVEAARRELAQARVQLAAGQFTVARRSAEQIAGAARMLGYPPLQSEADLIMGRAMMELHDPATATRFADLASFAFANGLDAVGVEAWARRTYLIGVGLERGDALGGEEIATALAERTSSPFARGLLANNLGVVENLRGDRAAARRHFEQAIDAASHLAGAEAIELAYARSNLALVTEDPGARERLLREVEVELQRRLGRDHPDALLATWNRVMTTSPPERAIDELAELCALEELHPTLALRTAKCWAELADLRAVAGDLGGATTALARASELGAPLDDFPELAGYALLWRGARVAAIRAFTVALANRSSAPVDWWGTFVRAKLELGLARAGDRAARATAIELLAPLARDHPAVVFERRLAEARAL